jgi:hypothetical protein
MMTNARSNPNPPLDTATSHLALIGFNHNFRVRRYSKSHVALWDVIGDYFSENQKFYGRITLKYYYGV